VRQRLLQKLRLDQQSFERIGAGRTKRNVRDEPVLLTSQPDLGAGQNTRRFIGDYVKGDLLAMQPANSRKRENREYDYGKDGDGNESTLQLPPVYLVRHGANINMGFHYCLFYWRP